ncbi:phBC6A51 family helix-turn-helix protein [Priestia aryabhattai]|uniref:phBC6A51 family helix-turn-helix protein n=1 Tax=Priestia aryabhattai TaxID=412384 RepID=UPI00288110DC|nr:phBC6A51 family helix-turn-helix protein [Priestia aryabhattai]MDT0150002.1 phBC6A51 family helix-turn-helix protein [Priestia aryabhattai]MDT0155572.1 phBC6A51 family helix-turn-helix protein [Priestia aryabhattai]
MKRGLSTTQKKVVYELVNADITGKTHAEIAEEYGVTERTIYRWKNDVEFAQELEAQTDINLKAFLYEANQELKKLIRHGHSEQAKLQGIKLVMQSQGKLRDVQDINANVKQDIVNEGVSTDELAELKSLLGG